MMGGIEAGNTAALGLFLPVTMRTAPSLSISGAFLYSFAANNAFGTWTVNANRSSKTNGGLYVNTSGTTGGQACYLYAQGTSSYAAFSAEL